MAINRRFCTAAMLHDKNNEMFCIRIFVAIGTCNMAALQNLHLPNSR